MSTTLSVSEVPVSTVTETAAQRLHRVCGAVRLQFTWFGLSKALTKQQKEEMGRAYNANGRFLTAGKKLVDTKHTALARLQAIRTAITAYWKGLTLPYVDDGVRLIRHTDIDSFRDGMIERRAQLQEAEAGLNGVFAEIQANARQELGDLYNHSDYPSEVRGLFNVDWDFPSIEPASYLFQLNPSLYAEEQARVTRRFEEAVRLAEEGFVAEFAKLVSHLTDRLSAGPEGEQKTFHDSTVTNLRRFFQRFSDLNVGGNAQLDALVDQASQIVSGIQPNQLRHSDDIRQFVATRMAGVQAAIDGMLVDRPRRRIIRESTGGTDGTPN